MKKTVSILLAILLFALTGCEKNSSDLITSPNDNSLGAAVQPNWIILPAPKNTSMKKAVSVSQVINGTDESLLEINTGYAGGPFGWVSITATARFQRGSFSGKKQASMSIDDGFGTASFSPSGVFTKPVIYNLTIMGVDLSNVDPAKVQFVYAADDGTYYAAKCDYVYVEKQSGKIQVVNAQLPHFSRYAFAH